MLHIMTCSCGGSDSVSLWRQHRVYIAGTSKERSMLLACGLFSAMCSGQRKLSGQLTHAECPASVMIDRWRGCICKICEIASLQEV